VPAGQFRQGATSGNFRITLPLVIDGREHWEGEWKLLLALRLRGTLDTLAFVPPAAIAAVAQAAALPFHAVIHARSNLRLRATLSQSAPTPGAQIHLRAVITEYGQPIETHPRVFATMTRPDRTTAPLPFGETAPGEFETSVLAAQAGVYRFHVQAGGLAARGQAFTREQLLSAVTGEPPRDVPGGGDDMRERFCEFLKCLTAKGLLDERLVRRLESLGIDVRQLARCFARLCHAPDQPPPEPTIR
jgi:hypothetical protein